MYNLLTVECFIYLQIAESGGQKGKKAKDAPMYYEVG